MQVYSRDPESLIPDRPTVLTIGKFDGIHRGHRHVLTAVAARARASDWQSAVIVLWPPPPEVLRPGAQIPRLSTLADRESAIAASGIDLFILWPFTLELSRLAPREFMQVLRDRLDLRVLVIGSDFALGHRRSGTPDVLQAIGRELGFEVVVSPPMCMRGRSQRSRIREHPPWAKWRRRRNSFDAGRPSPVPWCAAPDGEAPGLPDGQTLHPPSVAVPGHGIYATIARFSGERRHCHPAVTSIGVRPTFDDRTSGPSKTFLLDYSGDLYDKSPPALCREARGTEVCVCGGPDAQMERDVTTPPLCSRPTRAAEQS